MIKVGAHVSAAVSLELSFDRAEKIGAEATQIFISPPQQWFQTKHSEEEIQRYKDTASKTGIGPNFIHGTYLINLATQKPGLLQKSIDWLIYAMNLAGELGIEGVIFHTGSHGGIGFDKVMSQVAKALSTVLSVIPAKAGIQKSHGSRVKHGMTKENNHTTPYLILENSAGAGGSIGSKFSELGAIIKLASHTTSGNVVKVCLDTCHAFAAGYDLKTKTGIDKTLAEFDQEIGLNNLAAIHANDCKFDLGSGKDRHENIGEGFLGTEGFTNLMNEFFALQINHPALKDTPFILEVPGFSGTGPDAENIKALKGLINPKKSS